MSSKMIKLKSHSNTPSAGDFVKTYKKRGYFLIFKCSNCERLSTVSVSMLDITGKDVCLDLNFVLPFYAASND